MRDQDDTLDLIVERFQFIADKAKDRHQALLNAARHAERLLYVDIYGAIFYDLIEGWGKTSVSYPQPPKKNDDIASWNSNWHISPYEYASGLRWKPFDGMQQFEVKLDVHQDGENYVGQVNLIAYVWKDGVDRTGILVDIVGRNLNSIKNAENAIIKIPSAMNTKQDIDNANILPYGTEDHLFGFEYYPDAIGDVSHKKIEFKPINLEERKEGMNYRDR